MLALLETRGLIIGRQHPPAPPETLHGAAARVAVVRAVTRALEEARERLERPHLALMNTCRGLEAEGDDPSTVH